MKDLLLPPVDQAFSALLEDLAERGLLDETLVAWTGEFGRSPKVNDKAGRDHWGRVYSTVLAGGGIRGGQVVGASDEKGMGPAGELISPDQLAASFYHALGIDHRKEYHTQSGRPVMLVREGSVLPQLFGG
jgi:uncharacterized protein (DUF1501 family)